MTLIWTKPYLIDLEIHQSLLQRLVDTGSSNSIIALNITKLFTHSGKRSVETLITFSRKHQGKNKILENFPRASNIIRAYYSAIRETIREWLKDDIINRNCERG